jgi:excisionase family DNA binding protein
LQVTKESIYRWVDTKGLPAHRVGRLLRFRLSQVDAWVQSNGGNEPKGRLLGRSCGHDEDDPTDG